MACTLRILAWSRQRFGATLRRTAWGGCARAGPGVSFRHRIRRRGVAPSRSMSNCYRRPALDGRPTMFPNWQGKFRFALMFSLPILAAAAILEPANAFDIQLVTIGNPGNHADMRYEQ